MSVEFDLGPQDHHKAEDFLAHGADGVAAIRLHALRAHHHAATAETARDAGIDVLWDPRTERLTAPDPDGYLRGLPGAADGPLDLDLLAARSALRLQLVEQVLAAHPEQATLITPPTFVIENESTARLVVDLADSARVQSGLQVRPRLILSSKLAPAVLEELAKELVDGGISAVELQVTPMTAERAGLRKVRPHPDCSRPPGDAWALGQPWPGRCRSWRRRGLLGWHRSGRARQLPQRHPAAGQAAPTGR